MSCLLFEVPIIFSLIFDPNKGLLSLSSESLIGVFSLTINFYRRRLSFSMDQNTPVKHNGLTQKLFRKLWAKLKKNSEKTHTKTFSFLTCRTMNTFLQGLFSDNLLQNLFFFISRNNYYRWLSMSRIFRRPD